MKPFLVACVVAGCGSSSEEVTSIHRDVQVIRDELGTPHVYAHSSEDAAFALGYVTAQDRLFQLDVDRRRVLGRSAELFGQKSLADDQLVRIIGFGKLGEDAAAELRDHDPEVYRALSAYASGINAFIAQGPLPPEYADLDPAYRPEPWRVADTMALLKAQLFLLAVHPETDLLGYAVSVSSGTGVFTDLFNPDPLEPIYVTGGFPDSDSGERAAVREEPACRAAPPEARAAVALAERLAHFARRGRIGPVAASNNLVVCGAATKSGGTMLANDPHLGIDQPSNFYELHLDIDDPAHPVHAAGFGFPGAPAIALGHNDAAAWGVTTVEADIADSYLETIDGDSVIFNGTRVKLQTHTETIYVRREGEPVGAADAVTETVRVVPHHGPILSDAVDSLQPILGGRKVISVRWEGFGTTHEARAFYDLLRAHSYADFQAALNKFQAGLFNFVYAGTDGDIGYYPHADYPIRAQLDPANPPYGVVPGDGSYEWTGELIPNELIPQLHDPPSCRIFTANNDPAGVTADRNVLDDRFYFGGTFDYALRARRLRDRLDALPAGTATLDDIAALQGDVHDGLAEHFLPALLAAAGDGRTLTPGAHALVQTLAAWDREDRADAVAPTIFNAFYSQLLVDVFADDLPVTFADVATDDRVLAPLLGHLLAGEPAPSGHDYLGGRAPHDVLAAALEEVAVALPAQLGADEAQWTWGRVHTNTFDHPLGGRYSIGPIAMAGGLSTVNAARYSPVVAGAPMITSDVTEGPNARIAVELRPDGTVEMRATLPTGESGVVDSPHYADQLQDWRDVKLHACHFDRADVVAHAAETLTLPAGFPSSHH